ncbi:hypothetical protein CC79DRAFT_1364208 [Sarocladium strictum]
MGSFGDSVGSLLDTYTKCLLLLRELTRGSKATDEQTQLGGSIRSSRTNVRNYYSSKVSESGSSFEAGDAPARSSLRRLVRRLRALVDKVIRAFGKGNAASLDYTSLMSLSQGSGLEAIRTMTDLSERVSVRSRSSQDSVKSRNRRKSTGRESTRTTRSSSTKSTAIKPAQTKTKLGKNHNPSHNSRSKENLSSSESRRHHQKPKHRSSRQSLSHSAEDMDRRRSVLTSSSDSTKLGEIRHVNSQKQGHATYPLWTYPREPARLKKTKLFGLFGR